MNLLNRPIFALLMLLGVATCAVASTPSDAQIAGIVVMANRIDIETGMLAQNKASSAAVKNFASKMVRDHGAVNKKAGALARRLGVTPTDSATSKGLKNSGAAALSRLSALQGSQFDRAYIEHEVAYHQSLVELLDKSLLPAAQNWQVKAALTRVRPAFLANLDQARQLQQSLR